jgi:hypothetical protein
MRDVIVKLNKRAFVLTYVMYTRRDNHQDTASSISIAITTYIRFDLQFVMNTAEKASYTKKVDTKKRAHFRR